ncbi:hypothetical protein F5Y11DRAFT_348769 [Daldinia sp. FL1419]|nr:hypothetical protein F5Y11DRAFT_348769 [Daldinia sp. FL1419]
MAPTRRARAASSASKKPQRLLRSASRGMDIDLPEPQRPKRRSTIVHMMPVKEGSPDDAQDNGGSQWDWEEESPCKKYQHKLAEGAAETSTNDGNGVTNRLVRKSARIQEKAVEPVVDDDIRPVRKASKLAVVLEVAPKAEKKSTQALRRSTRAAAATAITRISEAIHKRRNVAPVKRAILKPKVKGVRRRGRPPGAKREWLVEKIMDIRKKKARGTEYLVKWTGFSDEDSTWEPEEHLEHCHLKVTQFNSSLASKK